MAMGSNLNGHATHDPREGRPDDSTVPPLDPSLLVLTDRDMEFLHDSISMSDEEIRRRIYHVQAKSYEQCPYPCIHSFKFALVVMSKHPAYSEVLAAGKTGKTTFLDIGCCMGTDARKLVYDGYPASNVLASDIRQSYIDEGYELYQDSKTCQIRFFPSDVFDILDIPSKNPSNTQLSKVSDLNELHDRVTHIHAGLLFHLFDEAAQYTMAFKIARLLKRNTRCIIFGRQQGADKENLNTDKIFHDRFIHSPQSWRALWTKVFGCLEGPTFAKGHVVVDAQLRETFNYGKSRKTGRMMYWSVSIL